MQHHLLKLFFDERIEISENILRLWVLIGTSSCIWAGLDCSDIHHISQCSNSLSLIDFIQEIERCSRNIHLQDNYDTADCFEIVFNIKDYLYLFERIHKTENTQEEISNTQDKSITIDQDFRKIELSNLNLTYSAIFLRYGC